MGSFTSMASPKSANFRVMLVSLLRWTWQIQISKDCCLLFFTSHCPSQEFSTGNFRNVVKVRKTVHQVKTNTTKSKQKQYIKWKLPQQKANKNSTLSENNQNKKNKQTNTQTNKNQSTTKQMNKTKQILQQPNSWSKVAGHGKMFFSKVNFLCQV